MSFEGLKKGFDGWLKKKNAELKAYDKWLRDGNNPDDLDYARNVGGMIAQMKLQKQTEEAFKKATNKKTE